jgi:serine protease Do
MSRHSPTFIWAVLVALFFMGVGLWVSQLIRTNPARDYSESIAHAVERVMPSVVVIRTEKINYTLRRDLFGMTYRIPEQLVGQGSGVVVDELGHIVTSWHVIEGARTGEVVLDDGTKLPVALVGYCEATDLAVLRIQSEGLMLRPARFGNSDQVRVGEVVIAIGSPFSLQSSVTVGHVSQKGRQVQILPYEDFIQTDAAINEGNSGGPLIDVEGRVIGINTAKKTDDQERGVGIAFAVPANLVEAVVNSIIETGQHSWPWLGMSFSVLNVQMQEALKVDTPVIIGQVWNQTSASQAGLQPGWGVVKIDDILIHSLRDIERLVYSKRVGEMVTLILQMGQQQQRVELELEAFPGMVK